jgi:hypothetical protein
MLDINNLKRKSWFQRAQSKVVWLQRAQSKVVWPHGLREDIMMVGVSGKEKLLTSWRSGNTE